MRAAFYKGTRPGIDGLYNRLGRFLDRGPYSHCELQMSDGVSWSSSFMDGGVRGKRIGYSSVGCWDFIEIPSIFTEARARRWFDANAGKGYDVWGNVRFFCGLARDSTDRWFCSEACAAALGFREPFRYGPNGLAIRILEAQS